MVAATRPFGPTTRIVFRLTRWALALAVVLTGIAMFLYPGGTFLDPARPGYSFFQNSLSDLGSTVAWSGRANRGSSFHLAASLILVLAGSAGFAALIRVYSSWPRTKEFVRIAGALLLVSAASLTGVALSPLDRHPALHGRFTLLAVISFPMATLLLGLAAARAPLLRRRVAICWFVLTGLVVTWTAAMLWLRPTNDLQLAIPATLQKLVALALVGTLMLQGSEADRARAAHQRSES